MARRRNAVAHRFARIKGLPPEEKALMQRIGHLMDAALNNRQASNPFEQSQQRTNRLVYPPTGLLAQTGFSSVKILWDATPSDILLRYEVTFTNLTTGTESTETTFTNEITYKGTNGSYIARVKSVGRDGSSSQVLQISFALGDDAMLIEGAKNGPTELGTLVQDNMELRDGYSIYCWGSVVLDKYMLQTNNPIVLRLWRADVADASFSQAYLVETITLYPGTESGTNLDPTARAGQITRPVGVRAGSFETSQSVMFSPQQVDPDDDEKTVTFFLQAVNRETEADEVCLSLVMWSGADGIGSAVPDQPFTPDAPYIFPHFNSFHKTGSPTGEDQYTYPYDTRCWHATVEDGYSMIGNKWTLAMWIRFDNLDGSNMAQASEVTPDSGDQNIFTRGTITGDVNNNKIGIDARGIFDAGCTTKGVRHQFSTALYDSDGNGPRTWSTWGCCYGDNAERSTGVFEWGDATTGLGGGKNDSWYFLVFCFEGGEFVNANIPKLRVYINTAVDPFYDEPRMQLLVPASDQTINDITQNDEGYLQYLLTTAENTYNHTYFGSSYCGDLMMGPRVGAGHQIHQIGIWNRALDSGINGVASTTGEIETLFNNGRGWQIDWRRDCLQNDEYGPLAEFNYNSAANLVHLLQAGAVEEIFATKQAGRDTGYHLPDWEGAFNWTFSADDKRKEWWHTTHDDGTAISNPPGGPSGPPPPDRYHQRWLSYGDPYEGWYDNLPQSWHRGTDIYDILSPLGTNGTTQYDYSYPGQNMSTDDGVMGPENQNSDGYPDYDDWVEAGADLSVLPWLHGPYPPGYHKDDPNRPIKGGTG